MKNGIDKPEQKEGIELKEPYGENTLNEELLSTGESEFEEKKDVAEIKTPKWDKNIIMILTACVFSQLSYMIVAPFIPPNFEKKGVN